MENQPKHRQFELRRVSGSPVEDKELLSDLKQVARMLGISTVPEKIYRKHGKYDDSTLIHHFGSWNNALHAAGLSLSNEVRISDERLFENLLVLWQHYGRQPRRAELARPPSIISQSPYNRGFGSWTAALEAFVDYANSTEIEQVKSQQISNVSRKLSAKTPREPSLRLKWRILQRDRFTCCGCGASPALTPGVQLHVDHILPWSKGGETVEENLQTLCERCNIGKSDMMIEESSK